MIGDALWITRLTHHAERVAAQMTVALTQRRAPAPVEHARELQPDFTKNLPSSLDVQLLLDAIEQSCARAGVRFGAVQIPERTAATEQLRRAYVNVSLQGSYVKLKEVLAEVLGRIPNATLAQLSMRRGSGATDVEATMSLALWATPAAGSSTIIGASVELAPR